MMVVMLSRCFAAPAASYNALLEICSRSDDSDRALDIIDRMADDEVDPDELTWDIAGRKRTWKSYLRKKFT
jgi:pentatricopeptide repeat protein